jgi:hypothetical protein
MQRLPPILVTLILLGSIPTPGFAWNSRGHMMVAAIAYEQLTPAIRSRVEALLKLNPYYATWQSQIPLSVPASERAASIFMLAATWADAIKLDKVYRDDGTVGGDRPDGTSSFQNTGYSDVLRHKYWHFVYQPFATDGSPLPAISTPNALDRIALFRATIASPTASDDVKSYDLSWLLHLVGDIHQPLHAVTRISATQPHGDNAGRLVRLCAKPCKDELHAFWNNVLGTDHSPTTVLKAAAALQRADPTQAGDLDPAHWATEDLNLAQTSVYVPPIGAGKGPFMLTATYKADAKSLAARQVALAGARLANVLNTDLK